MLRLNDLKPARGSKVRRKRVGRGDGSGHGTYSGRGVKGQKARSGYRRMPGFEGGQTPLWKRVPKRGFTNPTRREYAYVNLDLLVSKYEDGAEVTPNNLLQRGIISGLRQGVKVLGRGECGIALTVYAHRFSRSAREKIEAAGGRVIVLEGAQGGAQGTSSEPPNESTPAARAEGDEQPVGDGEDGGD